MQCASASAACIVIIYSTLWNAYLLCGSVGVVCVARYHVHTASSRFVDHGVVLPYRSLFSTSTMPNNLLENLVAHRESHPYFTDRGSDTLDYLSTVVLLGRWAYLVLLWRPLQPVIYKGWSSFQLHRGQGSVSSSPCFPTDRRTAEKRSSLNEKREIARSVLQTFSHGNTSISSLPIVSLVLTPRPIILRFVPTFADATWSFQCYFRDD